MLSSSPLIRRSRSPQGLAAVGGLHFDREARNQNEAYKIRTVGALMVPLTSALNFMPTSTALLSRPSTTDGTVDAGQTVTDSFV